MMIKPTNTILATAPMVDWTDRHCLYLFSLLAPRAALYTEMIVDKAVIFGNREQLLRFDACENPVILQLGGSDCEEMRQAVHYAEPYGYDSYNINVGCPSSRVQAGAFGACLMAEPDTVACCFRAIQQETDKPISIKTRLGIDEQDSVEFLYKFIDTTAAAGCRQYTIHARKAILGGLSPKQNREIPPLDYERVYQLKQDFKSLDIMINGGIKTIEECREHLGQVDGIMIGRVAYQTPYKLAEIHADLFGITAPTRSEILRQYLQYMLRHADVPVHILTKPLIGLFKGEPNAKQWRRFLGEKQSVTPSMFNEFL